MSCAADKMRIDFALSERHVEATLIQLLDNVMCQVGCEPFNNVGCVVMRLPIGVTASIIF